MIKKYFHLVILIIPVLLLLPSIGSFPYPSPDSLYSDITLTHYPNAIFLKSALTQWHSIPLWSPTIFSGYPFAANPLSGIWYPPGWLALLLPLPLGFNLLVVMHFIWGALGMLLFLKSEGLSDYAALFGGLAFASMPKLFAHYGAGHLTLLYAIHWTPWVLYFTRRACSLQHPVISAGFVVTDLFVSVSLALTLLADIRWGAFCVVLWVAFAVYHFILSGRSLWQTVKAIWWYLGVALLLTAPLLLPLAEFVRLSTRITLSPGEQTAFSLPYNRLLGFFFPEIGGFHEWVVYTGGILVVLGFVSFLIIKPDRNERFWQVVLIVSLLYSLGSNLPGFSLITKVPGWDLLRVPARSLFVTGLAFAVLSSYSLKRLLSSCISFQLNKLNLALVALVGFVSFIIIGIYILHVKAIYSFVWGTVVILLGCLWIYLRQKTKLPLKFWLLGLFLISTLDWVMVNRHNFTPHLPSAVLGQGEALADFLAKQPGDFRIYSPSYSLPQHTATRFNLEQTDGVDPLQLNAYKLFMERASGIPNTSYSITLPPFQNGTPDFANRDFRPVAKLLGILNVKYVISEYELPVAGLDELTRFGDTIVYENMNVLPRVWVQPVEANLGEGIIPAQITLLSPNQIIASADGPGLLVLSELYYPGWMVKVDGEQGELIAVNNLLRGVILASGRHQVRFEYQPLSLYIGISLWFLGVIILLVICKKST